MFTLLAKITSYSNFLFGLPCFELIKLPIRSPPLVEVLPRRFQVHVCGISAGSRDAFWFIFVTHTATAQPLDVAYNFPLKASLTRVATAHFSKLFLDAIESDDKGARQVDTSVIAKAIFAALGGSGLERAEPAGRCSRIWVATRVYQQARTEKLSLRRPKNCTRRRSSFGQWAPAVEGFQKSSPAMVRTHQQRQQMRTARRRRRRRRRSSRC